MPSKAEDAATPVHSPATHVGEPHGAGSSWPAPDPVQATVAIWGLNQWTVDLPPSSTIVRFIQNQSLKILREIRSTKNQKLNKQKITKTKQKKYLKKIPIKGIYPNSCSIMSTHQKLVKYLT